MESSQQPIIDYQSPDPTATKKRWLRRGTRFSFTMYGLWFFIGMSLLCYCPLPFAIASGFAVFPLLIGPRKYHRYIALFLVGFGIIATVNTAKRKAAEAAASARATATATTQPTTQH